MDLSQLSESVRHAELADVVITPRFGPGEWRDFHLADLFLAAGRAAAEEQLPTTRLAGPASRRARLNRSTREAQLTEQSFGFEDLKRILVDRVGLPEDVVKDEPELTFEDMGLDSLAFVEIQLAMEQEYGFSVADEDAERILNVGEAIELRQRAPRRAGVM